MKVEREYVTPPRRRFFSERVNDSSSESECEMEFNFDLSVAGQHSYLGSGGRGQERNKKIIYPANTILDIPILEEINTIILPGQDVPINAVSSKTKRLIREVLDSDNEMMGYILRVTDIKSKIPNFEKNETNDEIEIGCLLRVRFISDQDETNINVLSVVAECQQRFVVQKTWRPGSDINGEPDDEFKRLGLDIDEPMHKYARVRILPNDQVDIIRPIIPNNVRARYSLTKNDKIRRHFGQSRTNFQDFVYAQYDRRLAERVRSWLAAWCKKPELVPRNDSDLSFWATNQIPSSNLFKATILAHSSPQTRLMLLESRLSQIKLLLSCRCKTNISTRNHIFVMSNQGVSSNFVNNHGYNHEMLTVKKCWGIITQGQPESEYSWFPGYTWQIINCAECWSHLGWEFRATKSTLKPRVFYGLTKTAIIDGNDYDSEESSNTENEEDF